MPGPNSIHTAKWHRAVEHIREKGKVTNPYAVATAALGERSFKKKHRGGEKKDPPTKRAKKDPPKKKDPPGDPVLPVVNLKPQLLQRGDDQRRADSMLRAAPGKDIHDFKVSVDPSSPTNVVPENDPPTGVMQHPAAGAIQSDGSMSVNRERTLPDELSAATDATKRMGATLPSSQQGAMTNMPLQSQLALMQQQETKTAIRKGVDTPSSSPAGAEGNTAAAAHEAKGTEGPTQTPMAPQQAQRAAQNDTLRPLYGMASPLDVVPSTREQIKSGVLFNDFHIVAPGFGLGVTNKLFQMNEKREMEIRYREPLQLPRSDMGPTNTVLAPPLEWQNNIPRKDMQTERNKKTISDRLKALAVVQAGTGSLNVFGDDYGLMRDTSAKGLPRPEDSVLEPVVLKPTPMERARPLAGVQLEDKQFRRLFDAERYPEHFHSHIGMEGGSTLSRRNSLKILPYPIGMA